MIRRRPVMGTVARTAVIAGTATAVSGRVAARQQAGAQQAADAAAYQQQQQAPPPPAPASAPASGGMNDAAIAQLKALAELHQQGILTDEEFSAQKAKILGS